MTWPRVTGSFLTPNPYATLQDNDRFYHRDLPGKDERALQRERDFFAGHVWVLPDDDWRVERLRELEGELARRRASARVSAAGGRSGAGAQYSPKRPARAAGGVDV